MAVIPSRLLDNGTQLLNGSFDEVTFSTTTPSADYNTIGYSEDFNQSEWNNRQQLSTSLSLIANAAVAPDGTLTAQKFQSNSATATYYSFFKYTTITANTDYTFSIFVKAGERTTMSLSLWTGSVAPSVTFDMSSGTITNINSNDLSMNSFTANSQSVGDGWYRLWYSYNRNTNTSGVQHKINQSSGSIPVGDGYYLWGAQAEVGVTTPSLYQGQSNGVVITNAASKTTTDSIYTKGYFDEVTFNSSNPTIYNMLPYTQSISSTNWSNSLNTVTQDVIEAPDGSVTASRIQVADQISAYTAKINIPTIIGQTYTFSFYVKSYSGSTGTWGINWFSNSSGHHRTTVPITGEWVRQSITFAADNSQINIYISDNRSGLATIEDAYVWGAQLEEGSTPSIYQGLYNSVLTNTSARKITSTGDYYVSGEFDEFTGAPVVDSSLLLWVDAGQTASYPGSNTTWFDLSANGNDATLNNMTFTNNNYGGYMTFSGSTASKASLVSSKYNTPYTGKTVFVVARLDSTTWTSGVAGYRAMIGTDSTVSLRNFNFYVYKNGSDQYYLHFSSPGAAGLTNQIATWSNDVWFMAAVTNSSTAVTYYLNGQSIFTGSATLSQYLASTAEYIGEGGSTPWKGDIAQVMVYSRALTPDEISQNFNALRRRYGL